MHRMMETASAARNATAMTAPCDQHLTSRTTDECSDSTLLLLFSLQFFLNSVELGLPEPTSDKMKSAQASASGSFLIGFQLLQYEIVLFDAVASAANDEHTVLDDGKEVADVESSDGVHRDEEIQRPQPRRVVLKPQHGNSCLFEADAKDLAVDLQRERDAPLALLIMQQDHGKARLVAFASIPIELHVGLLSKSGGSEDTAALNKEMRFRVCEWASSSGNWELRDHQSRVIGVATGAATLSCLGRTLAPHIVNAIGLQVEKAVSPSIQPRCSLQDSLVSIHAPSGAPDDCDDQRESWKSCKVGIERAKTGSGIEFSSVDNGVGLKAEKAVWSVAQKTNMAVQCDEDRLTAEEAGSAVHSVPRTVSRGNCQVYPAIHIESQRKHAKNSLGEYPLGSSPARYSRSPPSSYRHHVKEQRKGEANLHSAFEKVVFSRDLPPPLFFQKPKHQKKK